MIATKTVMKMEHFHDFYVLEAIRAEITTKLATDPELQFRQAVEKYMLDLDEYSENLYANIALRTFVYLFAACLGESRHACSSQAKERFIRLCSQNRSELFSLVSTYAPTPRNFNKLTAVFDQKWHSGFGGQAWKGISQALYQYGSVPDAAFIDHVIDLEHNNGTVFNKTDARSALYFDVEYPDKFHNFLNYKFAKNILREPMYSERYETYLSITRKTLVMLERFCNIFRHPLPNWYRAKLPTLTTYDVTWGTESLELEEKWCDWVTTVKENKPNPHAFLEMCGLEGVYTPNFSATQLRKHIHGLIKKHKPCVRKWTKSFAAKVKQEAEKWIQANEGQCKLEKAKQTFHVLPFTAQMSGDWSIVLNIFAPYQGYGTETGEGFTVTIPSMLSGISTFEGVLNGHCMLQYGEVVMQLGKNIYTIVNKELEAVLE